MNESLASFMAEVIVEATERRCACLMLRDDPFFRRLPSAKEGEAIEWAFAAGQAAAQKITTEYGRSTERIASSLQVRVTRAETAMVAGKAVLFSEYRDRPPTITIYSRSVEETNRLIRENGLAKALGLEDVTPVHVAHELYHHLEAKKLTEGTCGYRVPTLTLGPIRLRTGLPSLGEIAADRFARVVLNLKVPPRAIQFITIHHHNQEYAWHLLEELQGLPA
ncbi:MAG TPA: hypothetical protein VEL68_16180 [Thermodesulfobacteriota bacterium]|nr:hypothetical protein [Thermodesulfobacteriota bacterium]